MPMVTPSLNLAQPAASTTVAKPAALPPAAVVATPAAPSMPAPSTTVTLSPQAMSAMAAASHSPSASASTSAGVGAGAAPAPHDGSVYESLKNGISSAVTDVGDAIAGSAHAVVGGVETVLSTANAVAKGILELPFAALSKASDAVGALIDEL